MNNAWRFGLCIDKHQQNAYVLNKWKTVKMSMPSEMRQVFVRHFTLACVYSNHTLQNNTNYFGLFMVIIMRVYSKPPIFPLPNHSNRSQRILRETTKPLKLQHILDFSLKIIELILRLLIYERTISQNEIMSILRIW